MTFQYALWDRLKDLNSLTDVNRNNLCQLCTHLISTRALSLAVLRVRSGGRERGGREGRGRRGLQTRDQDGQLVSSSFDPCLPFTTIQVVEFAELDKTGVKFYKRLLRSLLCDHPEDTCRSAGETEGSL